MWTEDLLNVLRENYPRYGAKRVAELVGKSSGAVNAKASKLGVRLSEEGRKFLQQKSRDAVKTPEVRKRMQLARWGK